MYVEPPTYQTCKYRNELKNTEIFIQHKYIYIYGSLLFNAYFMYNNIQCHCLISFSFEYLFSNFSFEYLFGYYSNCTESISHRKGLHFPVHQWRSCDVSRRRTPSDNGRDIEWPSLREGEPGYRSHQQHFNAQYFASGEDHLPQRPYEVRSVILWLPLILMMKW